MTTPRPRAVFYPHVLPRLAVVPALLALAACGHSSTPGWALSPSSAASTAPASAPATTPSATQAMAPTTPQASSAAPHGTTTVTVTAPAGTATTGAASSTLDVRDLDQVAFASPSGRIQCYWSDIDGKGSMTCAVEEADWTPKPGTPACDLAEGDEASLDASGAGQLTCHGDTTLGVAVLGQPGTGWTGRPHAATATWHGQGVGAVPYGTTILLGDQMSCTSRTSGLTCSNRAGHGFTVARQGYSVS